MYDLMESDTVPARDIRIYLTILGLAEGASQEDVEVKYRELAAHLGSSRFPAGLAEYGRQQEALVDEAYAVLLDHFALSPEPLQPTRRSGRKAGPSSEQRPAEPMAPGRPTRTIRLRPLLMAGVLAAVIGGAIVLARVGTGSNSSASAASVTQQEPDVVPVDAKRAAELAKVLQQDPQNAAALFEMGEMNFLATQWQLAIDWFTRLIAVDPTNVHARTDVGTAQFNLGLIDDAKKTWLAALQFAPDDVQLNFNLGFLYANAEPQDLAAARKAWQKVIDSDPTSSLAKTAQTHMAGLVDAGTGSSK